MGERYDAIIIGAGIIGACTAFELAERGRRTLNVDSSRRRLAGPAARARSSAPTIRPSMAGARLRELLLRDRLGRLFGRGGERRLAAFQCRLLVMRTPTTAT